MVISNITGESFMAWRILSQRHLVILGVGYTIVNNTYLNWVIEKTPTKWWHDSAEEAELDLGLQRGAIGVTTNPFLANIALNKNRSQWSAAIEEVIARNLPAEGKADALMQVAATRAAAEQLPEHPASGGHSESV